MRTRDLAAIAAATLALGTLLPGCSRTGLIVPPPLSRPSPDIECGTQPRTSSMRFDLRFDRTFSTFPRVNRVTWNIRHRCLLRTNDAPRSATPQNCPRCFFLRTEFVRVDHSPGHPLAFAPTDWSFYRIRDPAVGPGRYSFETAGAPSARYCVDVYVEYANGRVFHSAFTTRLLTAAVHTDTEFLVTQEGGTPRILRQFTAEETPANCAWS